MVQYKDSRLALVVIITLICLSCMNKKKINKIDNCSSLKFLGIVDTLFVSNDDYNIVEKDYQLEIIFEKEEVVKKIESIECIELHFCINGKTFVAKSNPVFSSKIPDNATYFFSTNADGSLMNIKKEKTLYIRKIIK